MATAEENLALAERFIDRAYYNEVRIVTQSLFYGMFLVVFIISSILLKQGHTQSASRRILYRSNIFIGAVTTANFSLSLAATLVQMSWPHLVPTTSSVRAKAAASNSITRGPIAGTVVLIPLVYIVADAMPIWRAYIMWSYSKFVRTVLLFMFGLNVASCLLQGIFRAVFIFETPNDTKAVQQSTVYAATLLFSVVVNAAATSLIGYKAWMHRADIRKNSRKSTNTLKLLILLVEAGFILCFIQIVNASVSISSSFVRQTDPLASLALANVVWTPFGDSYAAAYPSLIVIILGYKYSVLESVISRDSQSPGHAVTALTTMQFAETPSKNEAADSEGGINVANISGKGQLHDVEDASQITVEKV
ncbi:hypothetical protein DL96DRAFT_1686077 [Flagelloscypha sp. PMI_526]|nr:hypothetical protein DL96DRAFT_1686077 [Flagelloscypha sp. PMI_526]